MAIPSIYCTQSFGEEIVREQYPDVLFSAEDIAKDNEYAGDSAEIAKKRFLNIRLEEDGGLRERGGPRKSNLPAGEREVAAAAQHDQRLVVNRRSAGGKSVYLKVFDSGKRVRLFLKGKATRLMELKKKLRSKTRRIRFFGIIKRNFFMTRHDIEKLKMLGKSVQLYTERISVMEKDVRLASIFESIPRSRPLDIKPDFPVDVKIAVKVHKEEDQSDLDCEEEEDGGEDGDDGAKKSEESCAMDLPRNESELDSRIDSSDRRPTDSSYDFPIYEMDDGSDFHFSMKEEPMELPPRIGKVELLETIQLSQEFEDENIPIRKPSLR